MGMRIVTRPGLSGETLQGNLRTLFLSVPRLCSAQRYHSFIHPKGLTSYTQLLPVQILLACSTTWEPWRKHWEVQEITKRLVYPRLLRFLGNLPI